MPGTRSFGRSSAALALMGLLHMPGLCDDAMAQEQPIPELPPVIVRPGLARPAEPLVLGGAELAARQGLASDTTRLLDGLPGVSVYGAGGISALPVLRGLGDERLRVRVDGADLMAACPNHMNSALSYVPPSRVGSIKVHAGVTPVSVGGDNLGGTIEIEPPAPVFTADGEPAESQTTLTAFVRSNGHVQGMSLSTRLSFSQWQLGYAGRAERAGNLRAARAFKPDAPGREGGPVIAGNVIASTAHRVIHHDVDVAWKQGRHSAQASLSLQRVPFEGFPNQRMDLTNNDNTVINLRYQGHFNWGKLEARWYRQRTDHEMDMGPDRYQYGTGMPMLTRAQTLGGQASGTIVLTDRDTLIVGAEFQRYWLYDWWPPVGGTMGPNAFWNIDDGRRDKVGVYADWETRWSPQWSSQLGLRRDVVQTDAAAVQGYDNGLTALWGTDAAAFNAQERQRTSRHWDLSAQLRYTAKPGDTYDLGYAHKTRSPSLYQRYPWSTQPMAALMNNFVGDGNGYIGNLNLRPEIADTLSASRSWQSDDISDWRLRVSGHVTWVRDYIDARRCDFGQCSPDNVTATNGFVLLQYANQSARLWGADLSAEGLLHRSAGWGTVSAKAVLNLLRGDNTETGEPLYNIMPANLRFTLTQQRAAWTHAAEIEWVGAKRRVSRVRNEVPTPAYALLNLRSRYAWSGGHVDVAVDNALNRFHTPPLAGAYLGQGPSMTTAGIPWGVPTPGPARSFNVALNLQY